MTTSIKDAIQEAEVKSDKKVTDVVKQPKNKGRIKAEALGVTMQGIIDQVPDNTKYAVLNGLIGSIGCSVIGTASTIVGRLERMDNVDMHSLERNEVIHLLMEADMRQDLLRNTRGLVAIRNKLHDQLLAVAEDDNVASWTESIEYMTQPATNSRINKERLIEALKACGIDDELALEAMYQGSLIEESADRKRNAELIGKRRGMIEWLIENVFSSKLHFNETGQYVDDENIADRVEDLPADMQNRIYEKLRQTLNKAVTRCASRFAVGDTRYEITDIVMLNQLIKDAKLLEAFTPD